MKSDVETLKEWCRWQRDQTPTSDEMQLVLIKSIENLISQSEQYKRELGNPGGINNHKRRLKIYFDRIQGLEKELEKLKGNKHEKTKV